MAFTTNATVATCAGRLLKLTHQSSTTTTPMNLNLYLPPASTKNTPKSIPIIFYLAGLTCTPDNGAEKAFLQSRASDHNIAVVYPDTSPRGLNLPGEDEAYDFGSGAGFYVDATREPWKKGYKMYSYVSEELPRLLCEEFKMLDGGRVSLIGHSMGGHGALTLVRSTLRLTVLAAGAE